MQTATQWTASWRAREPLCEISDKSLSLSGLPLPLQQNHKAYLRCQKSLLGPVRPGDPRSQSSGHSCCAALATSKYQEIPRSLSWWGVGRKRGRHHLFLNLTFRYVVAPWTPTQPLSAGPRLPAQPSPSPSAELLGQPGSQRTSKARLVGPASEELAKRWMEGSGSPATVRARDRARDTAEARAKTAQRVSR